jgi:hypothetical protein
LGYNTFWLFEWWGDGRELSFAWAIMERTTIFLVDGRTWRSMKRGVHCFIDAVRRTVNEILIFLEIVLI